MILVIDNYDSFVFNLSRYVNMLGYETEVIRNDKITIAQIKTELKPSHIIISPGPGMPLDAGISIRVIQELGEQVPILGVCLGHQAIAQAFGGVITKANKPMHGMATLIKHDQQGIFINVDNPLRAARYHSLIVCKDQLPSCLHVNACSDEGEIMALQHKQLPIFGVQFHPESILTSCGINLIENFLMCTVNASSYMTRPDA